MRRGRWWSCTSAPRGRIRAGLAVLVSAALCGVTLSGTTQAADLGDGTIHLRHTAVSASLVAGPAASHRFESVHPVDTWIVAFDGPATDGVRAQIESAGGRIVGYVPSSAYLVRGSSATAQALSGAGRILRVERVRAAWRVDPDLDVPALDSSDDPLVLVDVFDGEDVRRVADSVRAIGAEVVRTEDANGLRRLVVRAGSVMIPAIASLSEVEWVHDPPHIELRNDNVRWVIQSNDESTLAAPLHDRGLFGEGQVIGHIDSAIQMNHCFFLDLDEPVAGPNHRKVVGRRTPLFPDFHGTHTAGTLAGDPLGMPLANRGMAPRARLSHGNSEAVNRDEDGDPTQLLTMLVAAHADGARIHSNSWGDDRRTSYTAVCVDVDTFSRDHEDDLVLFAITNSGLLKTPENAKNALAVGASKGAPLQHEHHRGGAGPTSDGRRKPEVYAPGRSTLSSNLASCAVQTLSGTSMACPAVAGGAALVREYFLKGFYPLGEASAAAVIEPTGALVKATVINSAVDMTGVPLYPSNREGWGRILLDNALYFEGDTRRLWLRDVRHSQGLITDDSRSWPVMVRSSDEPLDVTLAFMDVPASLMAAVASVNDLDLEVEGPDGLFLGNRFDSAAGVSVAGGSKDPLNNVERVRVESPTPGSWTVRVVGASVPAGMQGFAVVANGDLSGKQITEQSAPDSLRNPPVPPVEAGWRIERVTPNPFRGKSRITFVVGERATVTLEVYDLSGRRVRTLFDRTVPRGQYHVQWDGNDDVGSRQAAGVYLLRLAGPGVVRTARTVYLRGN